MTKANPKCKTCAFCGIKTDYYFRTVLDRIVCKNCATDSNILEVLK